MTISDEELKNRLSEKNAIVVHFSHHANMREGGYFPQDLRDAIANKDKWNLSCCVVWPGHNMNLPGSVGIIFEPASSNVVSVSSGDSGSNMTPDGTDQSLGVPLSAESLSDTFFPPINGYNEWRLNGAAIKGIYVSNPAAILTKRKKEFLECPEPFTEIACESNTLSEICKEFTDLPVYTFCQDKLIKLCE